MSNYVKVLDHKGLVRDMSSKAILNIDRQALEEHRKKRNIMQNLIGNTEKIKIIEEEMNDIKLLLLQILSNQKGFNG